MKRQTFILLSLVMAMLSLANVRANAVPVRVYFEVHHQVGYVDPNDDQEKRHRTPIQPPLIYIEDGTLTFATPCDGCELRLVNAEDEVEYTTVISGSTLELPSDLSGTYVLEIICGDYVFLGEITL